ncbi:MAG: hypothetical protein KGV46_03275 [Pasteurella sp.]|nr:hypothetical protein [Pasteurella sp.]
MQERYHIPAGKVQMAMDVSVLIASFAFMNFYCWCGHFKYDNRYESSDG